MSTPNFGYLEGLTDLEEVNGALAQLKRTLDFYFQGKISTSNVRELGGWFATEDSLMSADEDVGFSTIDSVLDDLRIWAGDTVRDISPFRVYESGKLVATAAEISGDITMTSGSINWVNVDAPAADDITGLPERLTHIGPTGIYTGEVETDQLVAGSALIGSALIDKIEASQIEVGVLTGFTIQTAATGPRVVMNSSEFSTFDDNDDLVISISPTTPTYGMSGIQFSAGAGNPKGFIFSNSLNFGIFAQDDLVITSVLGTTRLNGNIEVLGDIDFSLASSLYMPQKQNQIFGPSGTFTMERGDASGKVILGFTNGILTSTSITS